jgi:hypothetical protein
MHNMLPYYNGIKLKTVAQYGKSSHIREPTNLL